VTGPYKIATVSTTYTSNTIKNPFGDGMRYINVSFWYPADATESYPLVVFSHGAFGIRNSNMTVYRELASHGYIVCSVDHPGHSFYTKSASGKLDLVDLTFMKQMQELNTKDIKSNKEAMDLIENWMELRCSDLSLAIDSILSGAAVWLPRIRNDIDAVVNIDGPYFSEIQYDAASGDILAKDNAYPVPILNIYSDQVWVQLHDGTATGVYAGNKIAEQIIPNVKTKYYKGAKHLTLTDLALTSPFLSNLLNGTKSHVNVRTILSDEAKVITDFFDSILK